MDSLFHGKKPQRIGEIANNDKAILDILSICSAPDANC